MYNEQLIIHHQFITFGNGSLCVTGDKIAMLLSKKQATLFQ